MVTKDNRDSPGKGCLRDSGQDDRDPSWAWSQCDQEVESLMGEGLAVSRGRGRGQRCTALGWGGHLPCGQLSGPALGQVQRMKSFWKWPCHRL